MKALPSKELLSEVLGVEILDCKVVGNGVAYNAKDNYPTQSINIAELALIKCKHWALTKGFYISSEYHILVMEDRTEHHFGVAKAYQGWRGGEKHIEHGDDETDAIIKACEWIREYLKDNA